MSVLIKGLDMPKNCLYCPLRDAEWNVCQSNNLPANDRERLEWCPLVEVPTPHGRLIDADDAIIEVDTCGCDYWNSNEDMDAAQKFIKSQITVIEAEE